jgi:tetratricopeptide (TPR) repeat protein
MTQNDVKGALAEYATAAGMYPEMVEIRYWQAITLATAGKLEEALPIFREVFAKEPRWKVLTPRLVDAGLLPNDPALLEKILGAQ